jgi:hypothetical protein
MIGLGLGYAGIKIVICWDWDWYIVRFRHESMFLEKQIKRRTEFYDAYNYWVCNRGLCL